MKNSKILKVLILVTMFLLGNAVSMYYWSNETLESMRVVPIFVMILALVYILMQILKRFMYKEKNWWDWLYYVGLLAIVLPTYFATEANLSTFQWITDFGSLFLVLPLLFDFKKLVQK